MIKFQNKDELFEKLVEFMKEVRELENRNGREILWLEFMEILQG